MRPGTIVDPGARSGSLDHECQSAYPDRGHCCNRHLAAVLHSSADYDPPIVVDQPVEEVPVEVGSGWYLRGDIGYNFEVDADGDFDYRTFDPLTGAYSADVFDTASLNEQVTWSAGFGYHFTDMLRADVTVDGFRIELRRHHVERRTLRRSGGIAGLCGNRLPLRGLRRPQRRSASWPTAMSISAPMSASRPMSAAASATPTSTGDRSATPCFCVRRDLSGRRWSADYRA